MFICIEGNIGAGKSTLAQSLAKRLKARLLLEEFESNPLLPLFYKDPKTYAFPLEYSFLVDRHRQMTAHFAKAGKQLTVSDYYFEKCLYFAKVNLSTKDYRFYKKHFDAINATLPQPEVLVYLNLKIPVLQKHIQARGRPYEQSIKRAYLEKIEQAYLSGLKRSKLSVLILDIEAYTKEVEDWCEQTIVEFLKS